MEDAVVSQRDNFVVDTPFTKTADTPRGDLKLAGYASTWTLDRDNEIVEKGAFDRSLKAFMETNPVLLWQHDLDRPIGVVEDASLDEHGLRVKCHVPRPAEREPDWTHLAYNKIKSGIVKTFSIGGAFEKIAKSGGVKSIVGIDLFEISVVSVPANPDSIFAAAVKSIQGERRPELGPAHVSQMAQILGLKVISDPELASMDDEQRLERYLDLCKSYRNAGHLPPQYDSWRSIPLDLPPVQRLERVEGVLKAVNMRVPLETVEVKAGRVLSKTNETLIRQIHDLTDTLLKQLDEAPEDATEYTSPADELARKD